MNKAKVKDILNWVAVGCVIAALLAVLYCLMAFVVYAAWTMPY